MTLEEIWSKHLHEFTAKAHGPAETKAIFVTLAADAFALGVESSKMAERSRFERKLCSDLDMCRRNIKRSESAVDDAKKELAKAIHANETDREIARVYESLLAEVSGD